ncbi:phosphoribosylamine--glycine ligase [Candidatus Fukatsuia anoeciicola]|uniref:phosphoribosylamine--glycine ligase n=1 Tax=Candidatus Fukatsuia anoeciicola TaxID=2994492 RepID=UPI003463C270
MNILIIGNGGREHALAWKATQSPLAKKIYIAPGNAGTALEPKLKNVNISTTDIPALLTFAKSYSIDLTIVGPEAPLVIGIVDAFQAANLVIFGPTKAAAQLEGSKAFSKDFLTRHHIPTAAYRKFTDINAALIYIHKKNTPIVIKANGLAAGKGVIIANTQKEAETAINNMLVSNTFGNAGHCIIIEEFLEGEEISFIVMVDGKNILPMATSQDYKRINDGNLGLNTGGMGAYSPVPVVTDSIYQQIMEKIIRPTVQGMADEGNAYSGFLYAGLMITSNGQLKVIEFNCRLGDPETQPIIMRMRSDLVELCLAGTQGKLNEKKTEWNEYYALSVVLAAEGYPGNYRKGDIIQGLPQQEIINTGKVFHAGTYLNNNNQVVTHGGRVLCVTTLGVTIADAQKHAYALVKNIQWQGVFYRNDIGC